MNKYRIGELVGRGGMGQVHSSHDDSGRALVIKRLRNTLIGNRSMAERLSGEAQLAERVMHHNVVRVVDRGSDPQGAPFMVMEHAMGVPLSMMIDHDGPVSLQRAFGITTQVLAGLAAIHEAGVIHGDVKSANILIGAEDRVTIIDFGLSRPIGQSAPDDVFAGTPAYMAPEVIDGTAPKVTADLYSVGIVLYEMLTGAPPFAAASDIFAAHLHDPVVPPSLRAPGAGISSAMDRLVVRLLAKAPGARFGTARELAAALDAVAATAWAMSTVEIGFESRPTRRRVETPVHGVPMLHVVPKGTQPPQEQVATPAQPQVQAVRPLPLPELARVHERIAEALDRAGRLIAARDVHAAIKELEHGLSMLPGLGARILEPEAWRIESVLAALYDGLGKKDRAARLAMAAHRNAQRTGCKIAIERTRELCERLDRRPMVPGFARGSSRFPRPR